MFKVVKMGISHSKQSLDISSTPKKADVNGKAAVEEVKAEDKITVSFEWLRIALMIFF